MSRAGRRGLRTEAGNQVITGTAAPASVFTGLVDWSSIVSAVIALVAVVAGLWVAGTRYQVLALLNRRRPVWRAARAAGLPVSWARFQRAGWLLLSDRVRTGTARAREELAWLSVLSGATAQEEGLAGLPPVPVPFTFAGQLRGGGYVSGLAGLAAAYEAYASSLRRRWLLRSAAGPLVTQEYQCATETAGLLMRWASFEPIGEPDDPDGLRGRLVALGPDGGPRQVRLVTWPDMTERVRWSVYMIL